jgi:hypothetical protein
VEGNEQGVPNDNPVIQGIAEGIGDGVAETPSTEVGGKPSEGVPQTPQVPPQEVTPAKDFKPTGFTELDKVGSVLAKNGLDVNNYFEELALQVTPDANEVTLSEESFKEIVDKYGEDLAQVLEGQLVTAYNNRIKHLKSERDAVYAAFGGEDKLVAIATAVKESGTISEEGMVELGKMLAKGGIQREVAIEKLKGAYKMTDNFTQGGSFSESGQTIPQEGLQPISRAEFTKEKLAAYKARDNVKVEQLNKRAEMTLSKRPDLWR